MKRAMMKQIRRALLKKLLAFLAFVLILCGTYYGYQYHANNKTVAWPDNAQIKQTFYNSVQWLNTNYPNIKDTRNPALWWMVKEASDISDNTELSDIFHKYKVRYLDPNPTNIWTPYFEKYYRPLVPDILMFSNYEPYQVFFVYALSCDKDMGKEPIIRKQLKANFCSLHYLHPRCVTHQLMSVRLMQERSCGNSAQLAGLSKALQAKIVNELTYDFRVTDSYIQRVLGLAEAGNFDAIKPVWVQRIIDAQNPDGGWNDLQPLLTLSDTKQIGWSSTLPRYASTKSEFHTTAQGIWLMALLLQHEREKSAAPASNDTSSSVKTRAVE
jgi:hypothetical protein